MRRPHRESCLSSRACFWLLLLLLALVATACNVAMADTVSPSLQFVPEIVTVGAYSDLACDYTDLRAALTHAMADYWLGGVEIHESLGADTSLSYTFNGLNSSLYFSNPAAVAVTVTGGYASCSASAPTYGQRTTFQYVTPATDATQSLITIVNDATQPRVTIHLQNLDFEGIHDTNVGGAGYGGVVGTNGDVHLILDNTQMSGFNAYSGGAISMYGRSGGYGDSGEYPQLDLINGSSIDSNYARGCGGIGAFTVKVTLDASDVDGNKASSGGGGICVGDDANSGVVALTIGDGSSISNNTAGFNNPFSNSTGFGGGIESAQGEIVMQAHPNGTPQFESYIRNNTANEGGAIYVKGPNQPSGGPYTLVRISDALFSGNVSKDKGGVFYSNDAVDWRFDNAGGRCANGVLGETPCSYISDNQALGQDSVSPVGNGGVAYVTDERTDGASRGIVRFYRTQFSGNSDPNGLAAIAATGSAGEMVFYRDIFTGNSADTGTSLSVPSALLYSDNGKNVYFRYNTVLANDVTRMFSMTGGTLNAEGSILWGAASTTAAEHYVGFFSGGAVYFDNACALMRDTTYLPETFDDWAGYAPQLDSLFAPAGSSPAIDNCDSYDYTPGTDIYGRSVYDVPGVPARWSSTLPYNFDLGAVEQTDIIFANGFGTRPDN